MSDLRVTDHALVRFLARAGSVDVEGLRARVELGLQRARSAVRKISKSDYLVRVDGMVFVVRGDSVTTVLDEQHPGHRAFTLANKPDDRQ